MSPPPIRPTLCRGQLAIASIALRTACAFVAAEHRHLGPPAGAKLAVSVQDFRGRVRGVALLCRPIARRLDDGWTLEVTRVATDGCSNACSALYGAARRVARAMGYRRVITYTRADEPGTSLCASGWRFVATTRGGSWDRAKRERACPTNPRAKRRWEALLPARADA